MHGPNINLFKDDLIKDLIFNTTLEDKLLLKSLLEVKSGEAFNSLGLHVEENLHKSLPQFVLDNFSGLVTDIAKVISYVPLVKKGLPILGIFADRRTDHKPLAVFVFGKESFYGYANVSNYLVHEKRGGYMVYVKGETTECSISDEIIKHFTQFEKGPEGLIIDAENAMYDKQARLSNMFVCTVKSYALFKSKQSELLHQYKGFLSIDFNTMPRLFDFETAANMLTGGTHVIHANFGSYVELSLGRNATRVVVFKRLRHSKMGPHVTIDKKTRKLIVKSFYSTASDKLGSHVRYDIKTGLPIKEEYWIGSTFHKNRKTFWAVLQEMGLTNFYKEIEKQQEDLYNEYKDSF